MRPHERLEVWQTAVEFVVSIYRETDSFPKDERFDLSDSTSSGLNCREHSGGCRT